MCGHVFLGSYSLGCLSSNGMGFFPGFSVCTGLSQPYLEEFIPWICNSIIALLLHSQKVKTDQSLVPKAGIPCNISCWDSVLGLLKVLTDTYQLLNKRGLGMGSILIGSVVGHQFISDVHRPQGFVEIHSLGESIHPRLTVA